MDTVFFNTTSDVWPYRKFFFNFSILKYSVNILDLKSQTKNKKSVRLKSKFFNGENQKRVYWTISRPWNGKINHEVQKPMCKFRKERKYTLLFILKFGQFFKCFFFFCTSIYKTVICHSYSVPPHNWYLMSLMNHWNSVIRITSRF